jgi:hypothetical protein
MSTNGFPPSWLSLLLYFGLFFGSGWLGIRVSRMVAPESGLAEFVSFLALPAGFMIGLVGWPARVTCSFRGNSERTRPSSTFWIRWNTP